MTRADVTARILEANRILGLTWKDIAGMIGQGSPVFYTAALLSHHALTAEEAKKAVAVLKLYDGAAAILAEIPKNRGALKTPHRSSDIAAQLSKGGEYRFYEVVQGSRQTLKALVSAASTDHRPCDNLRSAFRRWMPDV